MKNLWRILLVAIILIGCRPKDTEETNTPAPTVAALSGQPIPVALSELAANPTVYEGAYIQLTGRYMRLPLLVCESKSQPSPATWGLSSDTLLALAGGFDGQLRPLLPENLTMTIAGRWQHWAGTVGCGDTAQPQDVWYLAASQIISPNPIAQMTLTPVGVGVEPDGGATAVSQTPPDELPGEGETAVAPTPSVNTTSNPLTPTITPQSITGTPTLVGTAPTVSPTSPVQTTPTPSNTPLPGTTPTSTPTQPPNVTPTSTPVLNDIDMGSIDLEDLFMDSLTSGDRHLWTFENEIANNTLTVNAVSANGVDIAITILDPDGSVLISQNSAAAGQVELVSAVPLPEEGAYQIAISSANNASGDYGLLILDKILFPITFDVIPYNLPVSTSFNKNLERIWFFTGTLNDTVSITADPDDNADIGIEFMGPGADSLENIDEFDEGETEKLLNYSLSMSGLYALWLSGSSDGLITVNLLVTKN